MLEALGARVKGSLRKDTFPGLVGMFLFLHFYYSVPTYGWGKSGIGIAAVTATTLIVSIIAFKAGNGFRSAAALIAAALALDFFYRGQSGKTAERLVFEYLWSGSAAVNFASFGFASVWLFSQLDSSE